MKLISLWTAGLLAALCGSTGVFARVVSNDLKGNDFKSGDLSISAIAAAAVSSSNANEASNDSFLVVDKEEMGVNADPEKSATQSFGNISANSSVLKSEESSGNPADTSGVPVPRAGWITFFGLVGVIALRHFSLSRRRAAGAG